MARHEAEGWRQSSGFTGQVLSALLAQYKRHIATGQAEESQHTTTGEWGGSTAPKIEPLPASQSVRQPYSYSVHTSSRTSYLGLCSGALSLTLLFYVNQCNSNSNVYSSHLSGGGRVTQWLKRGSKVSEGSKWNFVKNLCAPLTHLLADCEAAFRQ